jgi:hypothetical protein
MSCVFFSLGGDEDFLGSTYSESVGHGPFHVGAAGVKLNGVTTEVIGHFLRAGTNSASHPGIEGHSHKRCNSSTMVGRNKKRRRRPI